MSRRASAEPLRKITLDVFAADHEFLKRAHGYGLAQVIRELIRRHVIAIKQQQPVPPLQYIDEASNMTPEMWETPDEPTPSE